MVPIEGMFGKNVRETVVVKKVIECVHVVNVKGSVVVC